MQLTPRSFWFSLNQTGWVKLTDALTGSSLNFPRANTTRFLFAFFNGDVRRADKFANDISNVASCTLLLRKSSESGEVLYVREQPSSEFHNPGCTYADWASQTNWQVEFELSPLETNWAPSDVWDEKIWVVVDVTLRDGSKITIGHGVLQLVDPGADISAPPATTNPDLKATQTEAELGESNIKWMSPLRVYQAIAAWIASNLSWSNLNGKPSSFPPSSHGHAIAEVTGLQNALDGKQPAGNYALLDGTNKVPAALLPSYVDDVLEFGNLASFPAVGETGKMYVAIDKGWVYRWSGSTYIEIVHSPGSTDVIPEGVTNKYFTAQRAIDAVQSVIASAIASLVTGVRSVAGRGGDVTLAVGDVNGLQNALDSKVAGAPAVSQIVVLNKASYDALPSKSLTTLYIVTA